MTVMAMNDSGDVWIAEPERRVPVIAEADVCVLGGGPTGVFAAVRAARLGARVVLVEKANQFGGTATSGLVNVWHSPYDFTGRERIVGGLTREVSDALEARGAAVSHGNNPSRGHTFNPAEMALELDRLVLDHSAVQPWLHTAFCAPLAGAGGRVAAALVENKDGRGAIRAKAFVDATGDGDLAARLGLPFTVAADLQPPTSCAILRKLYQEGYSFREVYNRHHEEFGLPEDSGWSGQVPGTPELQMFAETHVFGADCADAATLTRAEMEGRRQLRACLDMLRKYGPAEEPVAVAALCAHIGVRETRRFAGTEYALTEDDLLSGRDFPDTIGRGTYRVDVHNPVGGGFIFKYLDGRQESTGPAGRVMGRWRGELARDPAWYNLPYRIMVARRLPNVVLAGRMAAADRGAYGALRVMVNLNQLGEAAGVAAALAARDGSHVADIPPADLRRHLREGGSLLPE